MTITSYFIAGTDTDVGKTFVSRALLMAAKTKHLRSAGYKPISAGCDQTPDGLRNEDALLLQKYSSVALAYEEVNPVAFADPVAPHLAAQKVGEKIELQKITAGYMAIKAKQPDLVLIEGAGGWRLPLGKNRYLSDFVTQQKLPVVLVVGLKLGCLNHALLTAETIQRDGLVIAGWVANQIDPEMLYLEENIRDLKSQLDAPCLGVLPRLRSPAEALGLIDTHYLF